MSTLPSEPVSTAMLPPEPSKHADIVSELVRVDGRYRGTVLDQADEASRLGERLARRGPSTRCGVKSAADAAKAKASS